MKKSKKSILFMKLRLFKQPHPRINRFIRLFFATVAAMLLTSVIIYMFLPISISFIKNLDTCFWYHIFDIDEIVGSTATCRSCGVRKNVVVCKNLEHQWDNLVVCKNNGMQTMVAYESDYRINTCSACGIRVGTKCPRKHKFGADQWGTMKCILCGRRLCKVDTDHIWYYERDIPPQCKVCGKWKEIYNPPRHDPNSIGIGGW